MSTRKRRRRRRTHSAHRPAGFAAGKKQEERVVLCMYYYIKCLTFGPRLGVYVEHLRDASWCASVGEPTSRHHNLPSRQAANHTVPGSIFGIWPITSNNLDYAPCCWHVRQDCPGRFSLCNAIDHVHRALSARCVQVYLINGNHAAMGKGPWQAGPVSEAISIQSWLHSFAFSASFISSGHDQSPPDKVGIASWVTGRGCACHWPAYVGTMTYL